MRLIVFFCAVLFLFLGGCDSLKKDVSKMNPKKLPDLPAFQDEFTRQFMGSIDEIEDGFYLFQSKTGKYTMMYPGNAKMQKAFYGFTGENYEKLLYAGGDEEVTGATYTVDLSFKHNKDTIRLDTHLSVVSMGIRYDGDFEKIETDDTEIYFAKNTLPEDGKTIGSYNFFGVVKSKESNKTLNYIYMVYCEERSEDGCGYDTEAIEAHVKKLMKSVTFEPGDRQEWVPPKSADPTKLGTPDLEDSEFDPCDSQNHIAAGCPEDQLKDDNGDSKVTIKGDDKTTPQSGGFLPNTATATYNLLLEGSILLIIGLATALYIHRRNRVTREK